MTSDLEPTKPLALTLSEIMVAIAVLAGGYAFLFKGLALILMVTMLGVLVLKGLRLPIITEGQGVRKWLPWVVWSSMLVVCPVAVIVLKARYGHPTISFTVVPPMDPGRAWALEMLNVFCYVHVGLSIIAAIAVVVLTRGYGRWIAWAGILFIGIIGLGLVSSASESIIGWSR